MRLLASALGFAALTAAIPVVRHQQRFRAQFELEPKGAPAFPPVAELDPVNFAAGSVCFFDGTVTTIQQCAEKYDAKFKELAAMKRAAKGPEDPEKMKLLTLLMKAPTGKEVADMVQWQVPYMDGANAAAGLYAILATESSYLAKGIEYGAAMANTLVEKLDEIAKGTSNPLRCPAADGCLVDKLKDVLTGAEAKAVSTQMSDMKKALDAVKGDGRDFIIDVASLGKGIGPKIVALAKLVGPLRSKLETQLGELKKKVGAAAVPAPATRDPAAATSFINEYALALTLAQRVCTVIGQVFTGISCDAPDQMEAAGAAVDPLLANVNSWEVFLRVRRPDARPMKKAGETTYKRVAETYTELMKFVTARQAYHSSAELMHTRGRHGGPADLYCRGAQGNCVIGIKEYNPCELNGLHALCAVANKKSGFDTSKQ